MSSIRRLAVLDHAHWGRYMGEAVAEAYGKRNGVPGELLVRVTPTKILFEQNIAS